MQVDWPVRADVVAAAQRIAASVERTPLLETHIYGSRIRLKCEALQIGGAFKLRGASNRLLQLDEAEKEAGVVAFSSGNHARGVAIAARRLNVPAIIVMPSDAPAIKVEATRAEGAEIVFYDRRSESREEIAEALAEERGAVLVPSFDDPAIVAGQGTVGLEILSQLEEEGEAPPSRIVVPTGGGGLAAGIALACPNAAITCVEPEGWDDMKRSLEAGRIVPVDKNAPKTLCDALQTPRVSPITFGILKERQARALAVSEEEIEEAVRFAWHEHRLVVEPGGAAALAALLCGKAEPVEGTVAVLSGGNVDPELHSRIITDGG